MVRIFLSVQDMRLTRCRGTALGVVSISAIATALELGGSTAPWLSVTVQLPLHLGTLCLVLFAFHEWQRDKHAMVK